MAWLIVWVVGAVAFTAGWAVRSVLVGQLVAQAEAVLRAYEQALARQRTQLSADERRALLLRHVFARTDAAGIDRVLTSEESAAVDRWVGLR